ncbi:hypothetical protein OEZ71_02655 [Defluviimonas sp. WL0050]|uniref:DUF2029 domain-containing protein n=1 Tax=Albidovulum litorale TaxID=2984134 RepID=A0ABT2ZJ99_9RHOB|nr:hypothetical protein [Defluviimonas sp. WL0050]MCV2871190.1 hypothetical protein [Defluviimonas sp. WL0050]
MRATIDNTQTAFPKYRFPVANNLANGAVFAFAMCLGLLMFLWDRQINLDTAWYLVATRDWLDGARLYVDIVELNPPLNFYFTVPPILLSDLLGISDTNAQYLFVCIATFLSMFICWNLAPRVQTNQRLLFLLGLGLAMTVPAMNDIGQREHFLIILTTPWLVSQLPLQQRLRGRTRIFLAAVAALGICLKPYFVLIPAAITLGQVLTSRSLRPILSASNLTMVAVGTSYVAVVYILYPEYFRDVVPLAREFYGAFSLPASSVCRYLAIIFFPFAPLLLLLLVRRNVPAGSGVLISATLAGVVVYFVQWKGFPYHSIPFEAFALMTCFWALAHAERMTPIAVGAIMGILGSHYLSHLQGMYRSEAERVPQHIVSAGWQPLKIASLSTHVSSGPPIALEIDADWSSRYAHLWPVPGAQRALASTDCDSEPERCARFEAILDDTRKNILADLSASRPEVLIVEHEYYFFGQSDFSWDIYMRADPAWSEIIGDYRLALTDENFEIWIRCAQAQGAIAESCRDLDV